MKPLPETKYKTTNHEKGTYPNSRYEKIIGNNASMVVSKTENANMQNNKESGTWDDFMNTLGSFMTANPQIIFNIK